MFNRAEGVSTAVENEILDRGGVLAGWNDCLNDST